MNVISTAGITASTDILSDVDESLSKMLSVIRKHLNMDVAFFSEFISGERVFKAIDQSEESNVPIEVGNSTPVEQSYCGKICSGELGNIVHDAVNHPVTKQLEVTKQFGIGSYIGVPITLSGGETYGTLCCFKTEADDTINQRDLSFLNAFAEIYRDLFEDRMKDSHALEQMTERTQTALLEDILNIHYQPIYDLTRDQISGFESLARFNTEPYRTPDNWFSEAGQVGLGEALEMKAISEALSGMKQLPSDTYLSVNVSPEYILNGALHKLLQHTDLSRLVLEVTEHSPIKEYKRFRQELAPLRERGLRLAIDDAGAGYASFQHVLELEADYVKLDLSLIRNIHLSSKKLALAKALCAFAKATQCVIIAEGVEVIEELQTLNKLGVDRVQGYLIGKPMPIQLATTHQYKLSSNG